MCKECNQKSMEIRQISEKIKNDLIKDYDINTVITVLYHAYHNLLICKIQEFTHKYEDEFLENLSFSSIENLFNELKNFYKFKLQPENQINKSEVKVIEISGSEGISNLALNLLEKIAQKTKENNTPLEDAKIEELQEEELDDDEMPFNKS